MKRGSIVRSVFPGDLGKPRPGLVIQISLLEELTSSIVVLPLTSTIRPTPLFRVTVMPSSQNGLLLPSQVMVDRITNVNRTKIGGVIGTIEDDVLFQVTQRLASLLGIA